MKRLLLPFIFLVLAGLSMAWTRDALQANDALPDMLNARYEHTKCNVDYADEWLSMRVECAVQENVSVFDSSEYMDALEDDLAEVKDAADGESPLEFGLAMMQLGADSLDLFGAIVKDSLDGKNLAFFSCVGDGEEPLKEELDDCKADALELERAASKDYLANEVDYANGQIEELDEAGVDTSGMEQIVEYAKELEGDVDPAFDSGDVKEVRKLHLRHFRLVLLFRLEKMLTVANHAEPIIEAGNNDNKEEILEDIENLKDDTEALINQCEYSEDVDDNFDYGRDNLECWDESIGLFADFLDIGALILEGA